MYRIAEAKGVENLIAGAWGCGVFMQDPSTVAILLVNAARNYNIPNIYFAIPNRNSRNWIAEAETKVVCRAKNKNDLLRQQKNQDYL